MLRAFFNNENAARLMVAGAFVSTLYRLSSVKRNYPTYQTLQGGTASVPATAAVFSTGPESRVAEPDVAHPSPKAPE